MDASESELERFPSEVRQAVARVRSRGPMFGPGWTISLICRDLRATLSVNNHEQVSGLALELAKLGYVLAVDSPGPCDYVFEYGPSQFD